MERRRILVAMSGGVDSSVAAALLLEAGHDVAGATIRTWASNTCADRNTKTCCGIIGVEDARDVAQALHIPYWVFNFEEAFKQHVVDHFAAEYQKGRTPNPCISCNEHIKFRLFLQRAQELGYDYIATGHYAQIAQDPSSRTYFISEGIDPGKDQSYVLFPLEQKLLAHLYLPVGRFTKAEIREKARALGLGVMNKPDSQEICFIPSNDYGAFLEREYLKPMPGIIRNKDGKEVGKHQGYFHFTKGQRRGLNIAFGERVYVIDIDPVKNEIVIGAKEDILQDRFRAAGINWFLPPQGTAAFKAHVKIRSQHTKAPAVVRPLPGGEAEVEFQEPQEAITPGQAAVFYEGGRVIGGGWISEVLKTAKERAA